MLPHSSLQGRRALVTGGNRGLGKGQVAALTDRRRRVLGPLTGGG